MNPVEPPSRTRPRAPSSPWRGLLAALALSPFLLWAARVAAFPCGGVYPVSPDLDFGVSSVGDDSTARFAIAVTQTHDCFGRYVFQLADSSDFEVLEGPGPYSEVGGGLSSYRMHFRRSRIGLWNENLVIHTEGGVPPDTVLHLHGEARAPGHLVVDPSDSIAVTVAAGAETTLALSLGNDGGFDLVLAPWPLLDPDPATVPFTGAATTLPVRYIDAIGAGWDFGDRGGVLSGTDSNLRVSPVCAQYARDPAPRVSSDGFGLDYGPTLNGSLVLRRRVRLSPAGGLARFLDEFHNPTTSTQSMLVYLTDNYDLASVKWPALTSSGAILPQTSDRWFVMPGRDASVPGILSTLSGDGAALRPNLVNGLGVDGHWFAQRYDLEVPALETRELASFVGQGFDVDSLGALGTAIATGDSPAFDAITPAELTRIANFRPAHCPLRFVVASPQMPAGVSGVAAQLIVDASRMPPGHYTGTLHLGYGPPVAGFDLRLVIEVTGDPLTGVPGAGPRASGVRLAFANPVRVGAGGRVDCALPESGPARLAVLDLRGREVGAVDLAAGAPGVRRVAVPGGLRVAGVYFLRLTQGERVATGKLVLLP